jgi:hypothetical protein
MARWNSYSEAKPKSRLVIDYCARYRVVPRKYDGPKTPEGWRAVSRKEVREGIKKEFGESVSPSMAGWTWEALGANNDVEGAVAFLQERREDFLDAGLQELADWDNK